MSRGPFGRSFIALLAALLVLAVTVRVRAQTPEPHAGEATAESAEAKKKAAQARFEQGIRLFEAGAHDAALAEFLASRAIFPTRAATANAASSLSRLHRFDEAVDMYEALLREFPNMPANERENAQRDLAELRKLVGAIDVRDAEPGSPITIDNRAKGTFPVPPIRVSAGSHVIRIYKEGFAPFETRVEVAGGQTLAVSAKMRALASSGRVKVVEQSGRQLEVVVDGIAIGKTPWEGPLEVGEHTLFLRGEGKLGTQPVSIPVRANEVLPVTLVAERLDATLRVEPTPGGARIAIDGVVVGRGIWEGALKVGAHRVEVGAEGFIAQQRRVDLATDAHERLAIVLERDLDSPLWRLQAQPKVTFELDLDLVLAPSLNGQVLVSCKDDCSRGIGLGVAARAHMTYQLRSGIALGGFAGYIGAGQTAEGRAAALTPVGEPATVGKAKDAIGLQAALFGLSASYRRGDKLSVLARLGAGMMVGSASDERSGNFSTGTRSFDVAAGSESHVAAYIAALPEVRAAVRFGEHVEASLGLVGYFLIATSQPQWRDTRLTRTPDLGFATYGEQTMLGRFIFGVAPSLGARYDF